MSLAALLCLLVATRASAATPVVVELRGANITSSEPIIVRFIGDDASVVEVEIADNGRTPDILVEDGVWAGRGEIDGEGFQVRLVAGTRSMPASHVVWTEPGDRHLSLVVRGNEVDASATIQSAASLAAAAERHRERWGAPFFWVVAGLVAAIAAAERWGVRGRVVGLTRVAEVPVLDGRRVPRRAVRVGDVEAVASRLVGALAQARTVIVVGRFPLPPAPPGQILTLKVAEPESLIAVVGARASKPLAVVVAVSENENEDWLDVIAELPTGVPVFVLVPSGEQPPELGEVNGALAWLG